jgi:uncharacterized protein (TIGR02996 family)
MEDEQSFLQAIRERPDDTALRLVFADWLEEQGDPRGELIRTLHALTRSVTVPDRERLEVRLRSLLADGVKPVGPFWTKSIRGVIRDYHRAANASPDAKTSVFDVVGTILSIPMILLAVGFGLLWCLSFLLGYR